MGIKPFLRRIDQVMGQQQDALCPHLLDRLRNLDRNVGAVSAARDDGGFARNLFRGRDDARDLGRGQRKEFTRATRREQHRRLVARQPFDMRPIAVRRKAPLGVKVRDGEGQQARAKGGFQLFGGHLWFLHIGDGMTNMQRQDESSIVIIQVI